MQGYNNLVIIGTSHISIDSIKEVETTINKLKPDVVALELDRIRFEALISKKPRKARIKDVFSVGIKGFLFSIIGAYIEKKLGKLVGVSPGSEMKKAIEVSVKNKIKIALIDQDIRITLRKIDRRLSWKEKLRFLYEIIKSLFKKPKIGFDLKKVPDSKIIKKLVLKLEKNYPNLYTILIKERNEIMAKRLYKLMQTNKSVISVIGAGHETDILHLIKVQEGEKKLKSTLQKRK